MSSAPVSSTMEEKTEKKTEKDAAGMLDILYKSKM